jgi:hypothetical protein
MPTNRNVRCSQALASIEIEDSSLDPSLISSQDPNFPTHGIVCDGKDFRTVSCTP